MSFPRGTWSPKETAKARGREGMGGVNLPRIPLVPSPTLTRRGEGHVAGGGALDVIVLRYQVLFPRAFEFAQGGRA